MGLLKRIDAKDRYWRRNRQPYVEPTEEQKRIQLNEAAIRRKEVQQFKMKFASMLGVIEAMSPGALKRIR